MFGNFGNSLMYNPETFGFMGWNWRKKGNFKNNPWMLKEMIQLMNMAESVFVWEGLPDTCPADYLEQALTQGGHAVFFKDNNGLFLLGRGSVASEYNHYNKPTKYHVLSSVLSLTIPISDNLNVTDQRIGVPIMNDNFAYSLIPQLSLYAQKLGEVKARIDQNLKTTATPFYAVTDPKTKKSFDEVYKKVTDGTPIIFGQKGADLEQNFTTLSFNSNYIVDQLQDYYNALYSEVMTMLGVSNQGADKKERLLVDEVNANNGQININLAARLKQRQLAASVINKRFGLNVSVKVRDNITYDETPKFGSTYENKAERTDSNED